MPAVHYRVEAADLMRKIRALAAEDAPMVTAYALTKTGQDIKAAEIETMKAVFDRPTRFTLNSLYLKPATKRDPVAEVYFKEGFGSVPAWRYLGPQVEGGARMHKSFEKRLIAAGHMKAEEFAVPGQGVKLDAFGNIAGSLIMRILSQVQAAETYSGVKANATKASLKRKKKDVGRYFVLRPDGSGRAARKVAAGIYWRQGLRDMVPVILFVKAPRYQKRFPFFERAREVFDARLLINAQAGFERFVTSKLPKAA
ncbi:hypothetical protein HL667_00035 [Bradyrhizobium sp. 83012]|uniref:Uncharacterized protein n=1 Tax=Bradyrhizobium aeschynomenes TaxID=2734909 RepID=A0ABX2C840_9BRAD|nr:hypothetical protein [Bradyrhizobium aeschynomenes]NPU63384.1 hypothetical protein [Bradyrhizobium aeschynomenes]